jgi:hypothetical protein
MYRFSTLVYWGLIERFYLCNCLACPADPFYTMLLSRYFGTSISKTNLAGLNHLLGCAAIIK